ncbi:hypothetical protein HJC23_004462 [Cyclotella cryptica]|uniref:ATP-grasp domain-containing protein n=1 Tax=Cyclotella cryptica TaxID=29204 RepID=A0ABD3QGU5_9STRA
MSRSSIMAPKPERRLTNMMLSSFSIGGKSENDSTTEKETIARKPSCSGNASVCRLEHSFSQSELSHFNSSSENSSSLNELQSDFVHLHSIKVHSKTAIHLDPHDESKEGFQFRSLCASREKSSKIVLVVPSIDLDGKELRRMCDCIEFYEERQLYHLLLANDPSVRIIYLSSNQVDERVVGYYLGLCRENGSNQTNPNLDPMCDVHQMLSRVLMIHVPSSERISLSEKILKQRNLIGFLRNVVRSPFNGHQVGGSSNPSVGLSVFTGSDSLDILSRNLGIRLLEASGDHLHYGTKQGSREIFAECGLTFPRGTPDLPADDDLLSFGNRHSQEKAYWAHNHRYIRSARELSIGIARQIALGTHPTKWVVKLNQGFSGKGNASVDLRKIQSSTLPIPEMAMQIERELETMKFEDKSMTWNGDGNRVGYKTQIERLGVIAESFIEGEVPTSPSVQAVIEPNCETVGGRVSLISTHEQLLDGQVYCGCINPASDKYREKIMEMGLKVGKKLAARGVVGHFSVDFLANQTRDGSWNVNALEINLRQGGTTHPHATMALLCGGCICSDGLFRTNDGEVRTYIATDTHCNPKLKGCSESQLVDAIENKTNSLANTIRWNKDDGVGVVFHLFKFVERHGRIGFTAIGRNEEEAKQLYEAAVRFLDAFGDTTNIENKA